MDAAELALHEQITREFIAADPVELTIYRTSPRVPDGAGGTVRGEPVAVITAEFRIIPQSRNSTDQTSQSFNGNVETPRYVVMSTRDFLWQRHDYFIWKGHRYDVSSVHEMPEYESKADVTRGQAVTDG